MPRSSSGSSLTVALIVALGCHADEPAPFWERVTSPDVDERVHATVAVTPEDATRYMTLLMYVAENDPSGTVRYQATWPLGTTNDPRALRFLVERLHGDARSGALHGLSLYRGLEACEIMAEEWILGPDSYPDNEAWIRETVRGCPEALVPYRDSHPERVKELFDTLSPAMRPKAP